MPPSDQKDNGVAFGAAYLIDVCVFQPLFLQNCILHSILVQGCAVGVADEGHELPEESFLAHAQLLAQMLGGQVVILRVGVDPPGTLLPEEIVEKCVGGFISVALAVIVLVQHPAGTESILDEVFRAIGLGAFRMGFNLANYFAAVF